VILDLSDLETKLADAIALRKSLEESGNGTAAVAALRIELSTLQAIDKRKKEHQAAQTAAGEVEALPTGDQALAELILALEALPDLAILRIYKAIAPRITPRLVAQ